MAAIARLHLLRPPPSAGSSNSGSSVSIVGDLLDYLNESWTQFHATGGRYVFTRNMSCLVAFAVGEKFEMVVALSNPTNGPLNANEWTGKEVESILTGQFPKIIPISAGVEAWRVALDFAKIMSMDVLEVEGDSQQAVKILNKEGKCPVGVEVLIEDTRHLGH
ncbi:hypothetical protein Vadar_030986 [Vaccinium darrowii]|nr:hypothetical protein Vadar_030986 [Vaccinium darrowii]